MNREKRESDYPIQLESQFIIRLPQEPAKVLSDLIKSGENFKNRLKIQINDDMRHGEVRLDHWLLHAKIVDLPTIVESWKTIDRKSLYKTADICQMMICKEELEETTEDETPSKNKKRDALKVDKKYLWPHGITPPTKNVRRRRFRKTLRKKCAESPEIEKEVKRLLRADNEAVSFTWEVVQEENEQVPKNESVDIPSKKGKGKKDSNKSANLTNQSSKVEDIFGGALSDSDVDDDIASVDLKDSKPSPYVESPEPNYIHKLESIKERKEIFDSNRSKNVKSQKSSSNVISKMKSCVTDPSNVSFEQDNDKPQPSTSSASGDFDSLLQGIVTELEELKQRRQRTQLEILGLENMTLRQRFQDILKTINKEIVMKEKEYHKLQSRLKSQ